MKAVIVLVLVILMFFSATYLTYITGKMRGCYNSFEEFVGDILTYDRCYSVLILFVWMLLIAYPLTKVIEYIFF